MNIFVSWSGARANRAAKSLATWTNNVLPHVHPFVSNDLEKDGPWFENLVDRLRSSEAGIVCLTEDSWQKEWLHFEAGALHLSAKPLFVVLLGIESSEVSGPFQQFQHTKLEEIDDHDDFHDLLRMLKDVNKLSGSDAMAPHVLEARYTQIWPTLQRDLREALETPVNFVDRRREVARRHAEIMERLESLGQDHERLDRDHRAMLGTHESDSAEASLPDQARH